MAVVLFRPSFASAQHDSGSPTVTKESALDLNLVLRLVRNQDEPNDSDAKKACLAEHPPISCDLLTVTLKNEGTKMILSWHTSCDEGIDFDIVSEDGDWEQFPRGGIMICSRNVLFVRKLLPGESYVRHLRLADPSLGLNTSAPPSDDDGFIHARGRGYTLLKGHEPLTIRARWRANACIASDAIKPDSDLNPFAGGALCAGGKEPHSVVLTSEALQLR